MKSYYSKEDRTLLLRLSRQTITDYLKTGKTALPSESIPDKLMEKRGVFVTLHSKGSLRGCIGYPLPVKPLYDAVIDNSISAAFDDPRFPPVRDVELAEIDIEISILTVPEKVGTYRDIRVGEDGIIVTSGFRRGLLLPQVPVEQNWTLEEFITYGCVKAGLPGDEWHRNVTIETFQAEVFGEKDPDVE